MISGNFNIKIFWGMARISLLPEKLIRAVYRRSKVTFTPLSPTQKHNDIKFYFMGLGPNWY